jgi:DNA-binding MarR family transcriptional regulator
MADAPPRTLDAIAEGLRQWQKRYPAAEHMAASTAIMRAQQVVLAQLEPLLKPLGLTFARYELLMLLSFTQHGHASMGKLGERLMIHPTSVTSLLNRLERQGYAVRESDPGDRRITLAKITPAGRLAAEQATSLLVSAQFGLSGLTEDEAEQLIELVRKARIGAGELPGTLQGA